MREIGDWNMLTQSHAHRYFLVTCFVTFLILITLCLPGQTLAAQDPLLFLKRVAAMPLAAWTFDTCVAGDHAYTTCVQSGRDGNPEFVLRVADVSDPGEPRFVRNVVMPAGLHMGYFTNMAKPGLDVAGGHVYVPSWGGLFVFDIFDPRHPELVGHLDLPMQTGGIAIHENRAYVISSDHLLVIDIVDPATPSVLGSAALLPKPSCVQVMGNRVYVTTQFDGLQVIDVQNPQSPTVLANAAYVEMVQATSLSLAGDYAYVAGERGTVRRNAQGEVAGWSGSGSQLQVIDLSSLGNPRVVGNLTSDDMPSNWYRLQDISVSADWAYVAAGSGLHVLDISNPAEPRGVACSSIPMFVGEGTAGLCVLDDYAYVADGFGLQIVDIRNPEQPRPMGATQKLSASAVSIVGDRGFIADKFNTLLVVDLADRHNPTIVGNMGIPLNGEAMGIHWEDNYVYLTVRDQDGGELQVIDVREPSQPFLAGRLSLASATNVFVLKNYVYVTGRDGLYLIDVTAPAQPRLVSTANLGDARSVCVEGNHAYVAAGREGLHVIDISNPRTPSIVGSILMPPADRPWANQPEEARDVQVVGNRAYVAAQYSGLQVVDVTDPSGPQLVDGIDVQTKAKAVHIEGNLACIGGRAGVVVVDTGGPGLRFGGNACIFGYVYDLCAVDGHVYVAGFTELDVFQIQGLSWSEALSDDDVSVRRSAVRQLAGMRDDEVAARLIAALQDEDSGVRSSAAGALGEIRDDSAVDPLIELLDDPEFYVRLSAVRALNNIGDKRAVPALDQVARNDDEERVRDVAAVAVLTLNEDVDALVQMLQNPLTYNQAVQSLGQIGDPSAIQPLLDSAKEHVQVEIERGPQGNIRRTNVSGDAYSVADALANIGTQAVEPLIEALSAQDASVRVVAARALGEIGDARALLPLQRASDPGSPLYTPWANEALTSLQQKLSEARALEPETSSLTTWAQVKHTALYQNYPNPFNPETWIPYVLAQPADVTVEIHTIGGRHVRTLVVGPKDTGVYVSQNRAVHWDGRNDAGEQAASGLYFYSFRAGEFRDTKRLAIGR